MSAVELPFVDHGGVAARLQTRRLTDAWVERLVPFGGGVCLVAIDTGLLMAAFVLAFWVRFLPVRADLDVPALGADHYVGMAALVSLLTVAVGALHGLYDGEHPPAWPARLQAIVSSVSTGLVLAISASYILGERDLSRLWFAEGWIASVVGLSIWRVFAHRAYGVLRDALVPHNRVAIVGANRLGADLAREFSGRRCRVVGFVDNGSDPDITTVLPLLGPIAQLEWIVQNHGVDELVIALPADRREQVSRLIARGFRRRVNIKLVPDFQDAPLLPARLEVQEVGGRPYLGFATAAHVSWVKRALDVVLTAAGLALLAPLMACLAMAIKLDSPGPIFYRQQRVGKDGKTFWMLKFRSMRQDADAQLEQLRARNEADGPLFKMRQDPRVTRLGRVLRRLSVDELPQLINVLRGEMSLVGPRPPLPSEVAKYEDWQFGRLRTVPGITGLWQVSGRSEVLFHDMVRLDLHYIRHWSLALDLEILLRTVPAVLTSRGAY